jgi:hypothetical protein
MHDLIALTFAAVSCAPFCAYAQLPHPQLTPDVTQDNISSTICVRGWTRTVRPPEAFTRDLKRQQIAQYGYTDTDLRDYEEDHLIPRELGGAPADPRNLWPRPHEAPDGWGSYAKDKLEGRLNALVCNGALPLDGARAAIATDWVAAFRQYVGPEPSTAGSDYTPRSYTGFGYVPYAHHSRRSYWYGYR